MPGQETQPPPDLTVDLRIEDVQRAEIRLLRQRNSELESALAQHIAVIEVLTRKEEPDGN